MLGRSIMDLNIEGQGEVSGWSPPIGEVLSPGFKAAMDALIESNWYSASHVKDTRKFIDCLFQKGYIIAKYSPN
jgi:hypothetical protein